MSDRQVNDQLFDMALLGSTENTDRTFSILLRVLLLSSLFLFCDLSDLSAQPQDPQLPEGGNDTVIVLTPPSDSTTVYDSSRGMYPTILPLGSINPRAVRSGIDRTEIPAQISFSLFDPLQRHTMLTPISLGHPGMLRTFGYLARGPEGVATLQNGRSMLASSGRAVDYDLLSADAPNGVELLDGVEAALFGGPTRLAAVNIRQSDLDVTGSYVRLAFSKGEGGTSNSDLTYSRNVTDDLNASIGFRRIASSGRYTNQDAAHLGLRVGLLFRPDSLLTFGLEAAHNDMERGLSGGLTEFSSFQPPGSVITTVRNEAISRQDVSITVQKILGTVRERSSFADTASGRTRMSNLNGTIWFTHEERRPDGVFNDSQFHLYNTSYNGAVVGARAGGIVRLGDLLLLPNVSVSTRNYDLFEYTAGAGLEVPFGTNVTIVPGGVVGRSFDATSVALPVDIRITPVRALELVGTARVIVPLGDSLRRDSLLYLSSERLTSHVAMEARFHLDDLTLTVGGYWNRFDRDRIGEIESISQTGLTGGVEGELGPLHFDLRARTYSSSDGDLRLPTFMADGTISWPLHLLNGALDLFPTIGARFSTDADGYRYNALEAVWMAPDNLNTLSTRGGPVVNASFVARIGSAFLKLEGYNLFDREFESVLRYPHDGRSIRFGITWALID